MKLTRLTGLCLSALLLTCVAATFSLGSKNPYISSHGINFSTGNKYLRQNDISLSGPVSSLSFSRNYNSQSVENSVLGFGWSFSWNEKLTFEPGLGLVIYNRADGRTIHFTHNGTDAWINDVGKKAVITQTENETGYVMNQPSGTQLFFDLEGRLIEKRDRSQNATILGYSGDQLTTISDGFGRSVTLIYTTDGKLGSISTPIGTYSYSYDANNNLITRVRPDNATRTYLYEDPNDIHNLTGVIDETSTRIQTIGYDLMDRVTSSALTGGSKAVTIAYQPGYKRVVTDSLGIPTTYQLEVQHGVAQVKSFDGPGCSSCGSDTGSSYTYDFRQQVTEMADGRGTVSAYTYDDLGNKLTVTKAVGTPEENTTSYTYNETLNKVETVTVPSIANPGQNRVTTMAYTPEGQLQTRTETGFSGATPITRVSSYTYDTYGRVISVDGPRTDVTDVSTITYYANDPGQGYNRGYLHTVTNALGHTVTYSNYNAFGQATTISDANGLTTVMEYNSQGHVISRTTGGLITTYNYDVAGTLQTVTLPGNRTISYQYTPAGQIGSITDSLGNSISYSYDSEGRRSAQQIKDPQGALTAFVNYQYDDTGRLHKTINPDDSLEQLDYDQVGNLVSQINELGQSTNYDYDALNRIKEISEPGNGVTKFTYDIHGNQTSVTDAEGLVTSYSYNDFGNLLSRTSSDSGTTTYTYDAAGNLNTKTDANGTVLTYSYDTLNRIRSITYPDTSLNVSYMYDAGPNGIGRLSSVTDGTGTTDYSFNTFGNLTQESRSTLEQNFIITYGYTNTQELATITYPSGRIVTYLRDAIGNVSEVTSSYQGKTTTIAGAIARLPFGPTTSMSLGNGIALTSSYDQQYRLNNVTAGEIYNRSYTYLATGQVENITDALDDAHSQAFAYDDLGRLVGAAGSYGQLSYSYDLVGNRLSKTVDSLTSQYTYQPNSSKLSQVEGEETTSYTYDNVGNTLSKGDYAFTWNEDNRLKQVDNNAETAGSYSYDSRGLRTVKTAAESTTLSIYDSSGNLLAETDETGTTIREFVYLDGQRLTLFDYTTPPEFTVNVSTASGLQVPEVRIYAFDETDKYTGIYGTTDDNGAALFTRNDFGEGSYHFRVDYLGAQFWSDEVVVLTGSSLDMVIEDEAVDVNVVMDGVAQAGVNVYAFTEAGTYLGMYSVTDENGQASFDLPEGENYKFRADLLGSQYWSASTTIVAGGGGIEIDTGGGTMRIVVQEAENQPLADLKTYLFTVSDAYLGHSVTSDSEGAASYKVSTGSYKVRVDYLGSQFWSETVSVTDTAEDAVLTIPHQDINIAVSSDLGGALSPLAGISCYVFTPTGSYLGLKAITNEAGQVALHLPEQSYRVRADYLGQQFWSEDFTWQDNSINIPHGTGVVEVSKMENPLGSVKVYAFSNSGTYLGLNAITADSGKARFLLPAGEYRFRADYQGSQYWGEDLALVAHQDNPVNISTGGGSFVLTVAEQEGVPMEGVRAYVFSETGTYLGEYASTDNNGQVGFNLADGSYKMRVDYLGSQYWTPPVTIPEDADLAYTIAHRKVQINVLGGFSESSEPLQDLKVYLFTPAESYLGLQEVTDSTGHVSFNLPQEEFKVRVDYFGKQYFSDVFSTDELTVNIGEGRASVHLQSGDAPLADVSIYVFSESDTYLGISGKTDQEGTVLFQLPAGLYKFRADYQSNNFWASDEVVADSVKTINLQTGGGPLVTTVRTDEATVLSGVTCYLFNSIGTYLGQNALTDESGTVSFDVADGAYKIRVDYLGAQFWSEVASVPETLSTSVLIEHRDIKVTVGKQWGEGPEPLPGVNCYLFTEAGTYTGITAATDEVGEVHFSLPSQSYKVRADFLGQQYWSEPITWKDSSVIIAHGGLTLSVSDSGTVVEGASVYLFSEEGSYLGRSGTTDSAGKVSFIVPSAGYTLRIDVNGEQFWTDAINVLPGQDNDYALDLTNDSLALDPTNNPRPTRWDGEPPVYQPLLAMNAGSLTGLLSQITTQLTITDEPRAFWYIADHLSTGQLITDEQGDVVWQGNFKPFGGVDVVVDQLENRFRFPGQIVDPESGLYYNWHRFYDPETGRYVSADPIGLGGGINLYGYVGGNPVNWVDPEGLYYQALAQSLIGISNQALAGAATGLTLAGSIGSAILGPDPEIAELERRDRLEPLYSKGKGKNGPSIHPEDNAFRNFKDGVDYGLYSTGDPNFENDPSKSCEKVKNFLRKLEKWISEKKKEMRLAGGGNMAKNKNLGQHPGRIKTLEGIYRLHNGWYKQHCKPCE